MASSGKIFVKLELDELYHARQKLKFQLELWELKQEEKMYIKKNRNETKIRWDRRNTQIRNNRAEVNRLIKDRPAGIEYEFTTYKELQEFEISRAIRHIIPMVTTIEKYLSDEEKRKIEYLID